MELTEVIKVVEHLSGGSSVTLLGILLAIILVLLRPHIAAALSPKPAENPREAVFLLMHETLAANLKVVREMNEGLAGVAKILGQQRDLQERTVEGLDEIRRELRRRE